MSKRKAKAEQSIALETTGVNPDGETRAILFAHEQYLWIGDIDEYSGECYGVVEDKDVETLHAWCEHILKARRK